MSVPEHSCRAASNDQTGRDVRRDYGTGAHHASFAEPNTRGNHRARSDEGVILDHDQCPPRLFGGSVRSPLGDLPTHVVNG
jgi:hypothetical protein